MSNPLVQHAWGNTDQFGCTIDIFPDDPHWPKKYQARIWEDDDTTALEYFSTWAECIEWFRKTLDCVFIHEGEHADVVALAPGTSDGGKTWEWSPVCAEDAKTWWNGSDYENESTRPCQIQYFPEKEPSDE